jgi:hypothetical protein
VAQCGKLVASGINRVWRSGSARLVGRESSWVSVRPRPGVVDRHHLRYAVEVCHVSPGTARASSSTRPSRAAAAQMYSTAVYQTSTSPGSWKQRLVRAACFLNFLPRRPVLVPVRPHALQLFGRPCPDSYSRPPPCYAFFVFVFCAGTLRFHSCGSVFRRVLETHTMGTSCYSRLGCGAPRDDLASSELPQSRCLANLLCPGTDVCTTGPTLIYAASSGQAELSRPLLLAGERDLLLRVVAQLTFFGDGVLVLLRSSVGRYSKLRH